MLNVGRWMVGALLLPLALMTVPVAAQPASVASATDTARFLAGLPPDAGSPLTALTKDAAWQQHSRSLNADWASLEARQLGPVRAFAAKHLNAPQKTLYYMFSGPDFLYADAFFPKATTYVLVGLEPVGPVPDVLKLPSTRIAQALGQVRVSISHFVGKSFFVTSYMDQHLRQSVMPGTLPVLYVFLSRAGKAIRTVEHMRLESDGTLKPLGELGAGERPRVAKITFAGADGVEQTLYYFNTDLSNKGVDASGFLKYLATLGTGDSFVKSASYLLHGSIFSNARDFLMENSRTILQDDTGVPVRLFKPEQWQVTPYGRYTRPIPVFARNYQKDMQTLFDTAKPAPLDFSISYRWRPGQSSVIKAQKKN